MHQLASFLLNRVLPRVHPSRRRGQGLAVEQGVLLGGQGRGRRQRGRARRRRRRGRPHPRVHRGIGTHVGGCARACPGRCPPLPSCPAALVAHLLGSLPVLCASTQACCHNALDATAGRQLVCPAVCSSLRPPAAVADHRHCTSASAPPDFQPPLLPAPLRAGTSGCRRSWCCRPSSARGRASSSGSLRTTCRRRQGPGGGGVGGGGGCGREGVWALHARGTASAASHHVLRALPPLVGAGRDA